MSRTFHVDLCSHEHNTPPPSPDPLFVTHKQAPEPSLELLRTKDACRTMRTWSSSPSEALLADLVISISPCCSGVIPSVDFELSQTGESALLPSAAVFRGLLSSEGWSVGDRVLMLGMGW